MWPYLLLLFAAIVAEVIGTTLMKASNGFANKPIAVGAIVIWLAAVSMLIIVLKRLEVGMTYAIWSGVGTALITAVGVYWFDEKLTIMKILCISLIVLGVVGLELFNAPESPHPPDCESQTQPPADTQPSKQTKTVDQ